MDTSVRARYASRGFSFVELLVTIIIAGIAFAALLPLFVGVQRAQSADAKRNLALNIAQDRVEKIRSLAYDDITLDNLNSTTSNGGQFGPTATVTAAGGATRTYHVDYALDPVPGTAAWGSEDYKKIIVDVYWEGNPQPVKHAVLSTFVYKQNAGPQISQLDVSPLGTITEPDNPRVDPQKSYILGTPGVALPVIVTTTVAGSGVETTWRVKFSVYSSTGVEVAGAYVYRNAANPADATNEGIYAWAWTVSPSISITPDSRYTFRVTPQSTKGYAGNTIQQSWDLERGAPPVVESFTAQAADKKAGLSWTPSPSGDLDYYEIYRRVEGGQYPAEPIRVQKEIGWIDEQPPLTNGDTYYYKILAVDVLGRVSVDSAEAPVVPGETADSTPPTTPTGLTATAVSGARRVNLAWTASVDPGFPATGILGYRIYRATAAAGLYVRIGSGPVTIGNLTSPAHADNSVDPGKTYYYKISAVDVALNESALTAAVSVVTANNVLRVTVTMRVEVSGSTDCYVRLIDLDTGSATAEQKFRNGKTDTNQWANIPVGNYQTELRLGSTDLTSKSVSFSVAGNVTIQPDPTLVP